MGAYRTVLIQGVTALAVMQLAEAGKLALDPPVQDYLAWFEPQDITVRHLLNQNSGFTARAGEEYEYTVGWAVFIQKERGSPISCANMPAG